MKRKHIVKDTAIREIADEETMEVSPGAVTAFDGYVRALWQNIITKAQRTHKRIVNVDVHKEFRKK